MFSGYVQEGSWTGDVLESFHKVGPKIGSFNSTYLRFASTMLGKNKNTDSPNGGLMNGDLLR